MDSTLLFSSASFVWSVSRICRLHRIPFAPKIVLQQLPPPYSLESFQRAAQSVGLNSRLVHAAPEDMANLPMPCLAVLKPKGTERSEDEESGASRAGHRMALLLRCDADGIHYLLDDDDRPKTEAIADFAGHYAGLAMFFERDSTTVHEPDIPASESFGFNWFIRELWKHKPIWRDVLLASLAIQLMALVTPLFTQIVIDKVINNHTTSTLAAVGGAWALFVVFTAALSLVRQHLILHTGNAIDAALGSRVFEHLFSLPLRYFEPRATGVLVARLQGVETIREFLSSAAVTLVLDVPFLMLFLAIMLYYSVLLTAITCTTLVAVAALSAAVAPILRRRLNHQFLLGARTQAFATEYISGIETVKSLQMEPQLNGRYGEYLAAFLAAGLATKKLANAYSVMANALEQLMMLGILLCGAFLVMDSKLFTVGMLVAFQMFASRLSQPMLHLVALWQQFQQADIAVKRLGDIMNAPPEPYSMIPSRDAKAHGDIEIRDISFRYGDNLPYLYRNLSFRIDAGACVAIMGPSGSGKSTLAKLLQGFYLPTDGAILIDGLDIRNRSANELRQYFGVVPQDTVLFSGTVYENLILAAPYVDFERVVRACKLAEIHDVIQQLPQGYRTQVGEHGVGLSGGQKQRIAIARALLKQPRILIFDEATSSLDEHTATQLAKTINRIRGKVTMIFIAHQLPKGLLVDHIINL